MPLIEVNSSENFQEVFSSPKPFIVHYYVTWCSACTDIKPYIHRAGDAEEYADLPIYLVDCDVLEEETDFVNGYPTTMAYRTGQSFGHYPNYVDDDLLKLWIDCFIGACRLIDSISDLSDPVDPPVTDGERSPCVTTLETKEEICDFVQTHKHAVVFADDAEFLPSWGIPHVVQHLAATHLFEQLKFSEVDGQLEGIVDMLRLPTPFVPTMVYLRRGAVFGLKGANSVKSAAELQASLKDFITASKIADTAEKLLVLETSFQKVSLNPQITNSGGRETNDAESPGSSADRCLEVLHPTNKVSSAVEITSSELFKEITSSHSRVVVHCYSTDVYSTAMSLIHDRVAILPAYNEMHFCRVDIDVQQELLEEMDIEVNSQETLILVKGKVVARTKHAEMNEFKSWLKTHATGQQPDVHKDSSIVLCKYNPLRTSQFKGPRSSVLARNVRAEESKDSVTSVASTLADILVPCTGAGARKIKPGLRDRVLGLRSWKDQEAHCLFTPIPGDDGIEVACAIHNKSRVSITVAHTPSLGKGEQVTFGIGFSVNVNVKARFTSAIFCVTFERYVDETTRVLLNIHDLSPRDEKGEGTEVLVGAEQAVNAGFQAGTQGAVLQGGLSKQSNKSYTLKTSSRVRGQGLRTPTATWTFEENPGEAGREGLEPEYPLHVHFSHQNTEAISIKFYAEAVLLEGSKKTVMTIGNEKELFYRELILSA